MSLAMFAFLVLWIGLFNRILLASLFPSLARSRRIAIFPTRVVFTILVALVVALSIRWVGILVIGALLVLPAATARNLAGSMASGTWLALAVGLVCGVGGLFASYSWSTATGGTIVLFAMGAFLASLPLRAWRGVR
jgi:zinc transport system permease protein